MLKSNDEKKAREYAKRHGFGLRKIPYSKDNPNGYIKITTPTGLHIEAKDMVDALREMRLYLHNSKLI